MSDLITEIQDGLCLLTINRVDKHNAFDNHLLSQMHVELDAAVADPKVRLLLLKANGTHFCAGADLNWMRSMTLLDEEQNVKDSMILGNLMYALYKCPKPTIAMVQGSAFGGGAGLAAACSIAIAADSARFCFSEVKLGLIPAVISPYVVQAIGARNAQSLFMSAEIFDAERAKSLNLVHHCVAESELLDFSLNYAKKIRDNAPEAVNMARDLVSYVANHPIDSELVYYTASLIAQKRVSAEGQKGIKAFLNKETPNWN